MTWHAAWFWTRISVNNKAIKTKNIIVFDPMAGITNYWVMYSFLMKGPERISSLQASISICQVDSTFQLLLTLDSQRCRDFLSVIHVWLLWCSIWTYSGLYILELSVFSKQSQNLSSLTLIKMTWNISTSCKLKEKKKSK